jgi:hypothetical protein
MYQHTNGNCDVMDAVNWLTVDELSFQIDTALPRQIAYERAQIASGTQSESARRYSETHIAACEKQIAKLRGIWSVLVLRLK